MDLTQCLEKEKTPGDLKTLLLDVYTAQENLINAQQEVIMKLLNENVEQETLISELMKDQFDS